MPDKQSSSTKQNLWTVRDMIRWATAYFNEKDIDSPRLTIEMFLCHALQCTRMGLYMQFDKPLSQEELGLLRSYIQRRVLREPTQYIIGSVQFLDMQLQVDSSVLIPRPETEELVMQCIERIRQSSLKQDDMSILDVGTGSGCIALALAKQYPQAQVFGIDISESAVQLAKRNAQAQGLTNVYFGQKNFLTDSLQRRYDVVVSNPPYIAQQEMQNIQPELRYEPLQALTDYEDGFLFYRMFARMLPLILKPNQGAFAVFEMAYNQADTMRRIFSDYHSIVRKDFASIERFIEVTGMTKNVVA